jgi:hypothetical protein
MTERLVIYVPTPDPKLAFEVAKAIFSGPALRVDTKQVRAAAKALRQARRGKAEERNAVAARLTRQLRDEGKTWNQIVLILEARGIPAPRGGHWHYTSVRRLLK